MKRRDFIRTVGVGLGALAAGVSPLGRSRAAALPPESCRVAVFGYDGLGIDDARSLWSSGSGALSRLGEPVCCLSSGLSVTEPGWATIWSGLPSFLNHAWSNSNYGAMADGMHIVAKLVELHGQSLYVGWVSGKGHNVRGDVPDSPHYAVYDAVVNQGQPGRYHGDLFLTDGEVANLGATAIQEAANERHFCIFDLFRNPDITGHRSKEHGQFMEAAANVDDYVGQLMDLLPAETTVIAVSDHGFNFISRGDPENNHTCAPRGFVATNFPLAPRDTVDQASVGRLIFRLMGGDPERCRSNDTDYRMYGVDM